MIVLFCCFAVYDENSKGRVKHDSPEKLAAMNIYPWFQDVHVMIFIGFGYLMTFLRKYGFSSVGLNFVVAVFAIQWHLLVGGFAHQWTVVGFHANEFHKIDLDLTSFLLADFAAAAVLISFGALLGKVSPTQLLLLAAFEVIVFSFNENINVSSWKVSDMGGSMVVHVFGAYFGLAASWVLTTPNATKRSENSSDYRSDLFAMIGTLFLWVFWPSFTGAPASLYSQERVVVNTLLALVGSALTGFCFSAWLRGENKFDMVDIQNATLAGGVAIGTSCDMYVTPGGALAIGSIAGAWSVVGYTKVQGLLETHWGVYDTCGVNNLHGMPGIIAGLAGFLITWTASTEDLGGDCVTSKVWPGRYTSESDCCTSGATCTESRSAGFQAGVQIGYLAMTLVNAIVGGIIAGYLVKWIEPVREDGAKSFQDDENWEVPQLETPYYFDPRGQIRKIKRGVAEDEEEDFSRNKQKPLNPDVPPFGAEQASKASHDDGVIAQKLDVLYGMLLKNKTD
jgi:ammonium transporter Rh